MAIPLSLLADLQGLVGGLIARTIDLWPAGYALNALSRNCQKVLGGWSRSNTPPGRFHTRMLFSS